MDDPLSSNLELDINALRALLVQWQISHAALHSSDQRAVDKALAANDKRLDSMNEFRDTLRDQAARFVTRDVLEEKLGNLILAHQKDWSNVSDRLVATQQESLRARAELTAQIIALGDRLSSQLTALSERHNTDMAAVRVDIGKAQSRSWTMGGYFAVAIIVILVAFIAFLLLKT